MFIELLSEAVEDRHEVTLLLLEDALARQASFDPPGYAPTPYLISQRRIQTS